MRCSNTVISFFEPNEADPKPCKASSPDTKSDSGIDLTTSISSQSEQCGKAAVESRTDGYDSADDDYEGDTSGTETDNDPFDEDYFLDVGLNELMLQSTENLELTTSTDSSTWCSNTNKFSNILNTLPSADNSSSKQYLAMTSMCMADDVNYDDITKSILDINELRENSDTESQMVSADHLSDTGLESDDEFMYKPVAHTDMNHYYLSATADTISLAE